jgi:hypothetical protein
MTHLRRNAIAYLALFVALGGSGYAALSLPHNSVGTRQLRNNAVTSAKVRDGALLARDFATGQLPAGAQGAKGDTGPAGIAGTAGAAGTAATIARTRLNWSTQVPPLTGQVFTKIRDLGAFTKQQASTLVHVTVLDNSAINQGHSCMEQIRIDGKNDAGSASTDTTNGATGGETLITNPGAGQPSFQPWTSIAEFSGLSAGTHTIQLWGFTDGNGSCQENVGAYAHTAFIDELG